jgi:hypothetical protein
LFGEEANGSASGLDAHHLDLRKMLVETLHPKPVHADFRQFGAEIPFSSGKNLDVSALNSRLTWQRVGKAENVAPRHFHTPGLPESEKIAWPREASGVFPIDVRQELFRGSTYFAVRLGRAIK